MLRWIRRAFFNMQRGEGSIALVNPKELHPFLSKKLGWILAEMNDPLDSVLRWGTTLFQRKGTKLPKSKTKVSPDWRRETLTIWSIESYIQRNESFLVAFSCSFCKEETSHDHVPFCASTDRSVWSRYIHTGHPMIIDALHPSCSPRTMFSSAFAFKSMIENDRPPLTSPDCAKMKDTWSEANVLGRCFRIV